MTTDRQVGINLKRLRGSMSQSALALALRTDEMAFHQQTIARAEAGDRSLGLLEAEAIASYFGCSVQELLMPDESALVSSKARLQQLIGQLKIAIDAMGDANAEEFTPSGVALQGKLLTLAQAAALLRTPEQTLRHWVMKDLAPKSFKLGRRRMFREEDIAAWLELKRQSGSQPDRGA